MSSYTFPTPPSATTATAGKDYLIYVASAATTSGDTTTYTWTLLGGQRTGSLSRSADEIDASHKTSGGWTTKLAGLRSWSLDLESVYLAGDSGAQFLEAAFLEGKQVHVKFKYPDNSYITGWAAITNLSLETSHDGVATLKGTLAGAGALSERASA